MKKIVMTSNEAVQTISTLYQKGRPELAVAFAREAFGKKATGSVHALEPETVKDLTKKVDGLIEELKKSIEKLTKSETERDVLLKVLTDRLKKEEEPTKGEEKPKKPPEEPKEPPKEEPPPEEPPPELKSPGEPPK